MLTLKLAWRNLFRNTRRTVLTVMLIGFSLGAMIITDAVIIGMTTTMADSVTQTLTGEARVQHPAFSDSFDSALTLDNSSRLEAIIAADDSVKAYAPRVIAGGMISSSYNVASGFVYGVDPEREVDVSKIRDAIIEGDYLSGKAGEILIGRSLAELLEVELGDRIVITLSEAKTGELAQALFRVSGIFHFGMREFDDSFVFINLAKAREILGLVDQSHRIVIQFENAEDARNPDLPLFRKLNAIDDVQALGWLEADPEIASMLGMTDYSSLIVGVILFLLASLGVINSMFMSIYERIYEIGVAKAIGTKPGQLISLVLFEAGLIALVSCIFGIAVGGALGVYFSDHGIPMGEFEISGVALSDNIFAVMQPRQFIDFPVYVVLLTLLAALYPARFASRIVPSEALHRSL